MKMMSRAAATELPRATRAFPLLAFVLAAVSSVGGAAYPDRMVRFIVPSTAGGGTDTVSRLIAPKMSEFIGQKIIIENRPGASGNIGAEYVAKSPPDGYTLLSCIASHTMNPAMMKKVPYDFGKGFAAISLFVVLPGVLISHPAVPARNVKELIALARARPGELQYASAGIGSYHHLAMSLFGIMTGTKMTHVPYKGTNPAIMDVVGGHVPLMIVSGLVAMPQINAGKVRAYGVSSAKRAIWAPELPTIAEAGVRGYDAVTWLGLVAPAGTPRDVIAKLHDGVVKTLQDPDISKRFIDDAADPAPSRTPDEFGALIRSEMAKWAKVVKESGIEPE